MPPTTTLSAVTGATMAFISTRSPGKRFGRERALNVVRLALAATAPFVRVMIVAPLVILTCTVVEALSLFRIYIGLATLSVEKPVFRLVNFDARPTGGTMAATAWNVSVRASRHITKSVNRTR